MSNCWNQAVTLLVLNGRGREFEINVLSTYILFKELRKQ